jgi:hypothetical protein
MIRVLVCTGKKKAVEALRAKCVELAQKKQVEVYAEIAVEKTKMLRHFEEFRVLYDTPEGKTLSLDPAITQPLDYLNVTDQVLARIKGSSFQVDDNWLKWNVKEKTAPFQLKGLNAEVKDETLQISPRVRKRICHFVLEGPVKILFACRDALIEEKLADPASLKYSLL